MYQPRVDLFQTGCCMDPGMVLQIRLRERLCQRNADPALLVDVALTGRQLHVVPADESGRRRERATEDDVGHSVSEFESVPLSTRNERRVTCRLRVSSGANIRGSTGTRGRAGSLSPPRACTVLSAARSAMSQPAWGTGQAVQYIVQRAATDSVDPAAGESLG